MPDGCRLSARIWMPEDAEENPVPVILEHLPYRKRDGTVVRDCFTHPWLAGHGYACLRVDMRGNGDSEGLMDDEYTPQELQDACDVLAWAASQPWSTGKAGMMGISWGGFNALQVAALRPPSLKAIITLCSTVDRFADDIHFKGGCLLGENFGWAANMLSYSSRPPDPALVGDKWRGLWLERLENMPFLAREWLGRQARDSYWKHGSVCEDYSAIEAAVLSIGGWHDGYRNTIAHLVSNLQCPVRGIVGPWIHKYPHYAKPEPAIGFLQEARRWWDRWLKGIETGVENDPAMRLWLMDSVRPQRWLDARPGRWIAEQAWPSPGIEPVVLELGNGTLGDGPISDIISICSPQDCGAATGEFFPFTFGPELPDEQSHDDARSLCFDAGPAEAIRDIVGAPKVRLTVSVDKPLAQIAVRLCDLFTDGGSVLITMGAMNLAHHASHENPRQLEPGKKYRVEFALDQTAYRLPQGHRLRLAISTAYWPFLWPSPESATVSVHAGELLIPVRGKSADPGEWCFEEPEAAEPWNARELRPPHSRRATERDTDSGTAATLIDNDFGEYLDLDHGLVSGSRVSEKWLIHSDDPLSASVEVEWEQTGGRGDWRWRTMARMRMRSTVDRFDITGSLKAEENGKPAFSRDYRADIERKFV